MLQLVELGTLNMAAEGFTKPCNPADIGEAAYIITA
jgi:hypothetical protein